VEPPGALKNGAPRDHMVTGYGETPSR
jgi:hypothetical protein